MIFSATYYLKSHNAIFIHVKIGPQCPNFCVPPLYHHITKKRPGRHCEGIVSSVPLKWTQSRTGLASRALESRNLEDFCPL